MNSPEARAAAVAPAVPTEARCPACSSPFTPRRAWQRFCSAHCRKETHRAGSRTAILAGMVATAAALGYDRAGFLAAIGEAWDTRVGGER